MARTKAQIGVQALEELGVVALGQSATAAQTATINAAYDQVWDALDDHGVVVWLSTESVPSAYVNPVVALVAAQRMNMFGISNDRYTRIAGAASGSIAEIRRLNAGNWVNARAVEDF